MSVCIIFHRHSYLFGGNLGRVHVSKGVMPQDDNLFPDVTFVMSYGDMYGRGLTIVKNCVDGSTCRIIPIQSWDGQALISLPS